MLPSWATDRIDVIEPVWVDERGKRVATYPDDAAVPIEGCSVQPGASATDTARRDNLQVDATAYLPPGAAVTRHAKILWRGQPYRIDGEPATWVSPLGTLNHLVLSLVRWEG